MKNQCGMRNAECGTTAGEFRPTTGRKRGAEPGGSLLERYRAEILRCVKCGACQAVCPSFLSEQAESQSARGRMALIKAVLDGDLAVSALFKDRLSTCTGCLACEAACPSKVPVTKIIQAAKEQAIAETGHGIIPSVIAEVLKHPAAFRAAAWLAPLVLHYEQGQGAGGKGPRGSSKFNVQSSKRGGGKGIGTRGRVVFFPGCAVEHFQPEIGSASINVLKALGYEVIVPEGFKCCGRPLLSLGDRKAAKELASYNTTLFETCKPDAIVTACASCGLTFKNDYPTLLRPGEKKPVVQDVHEFFLSRLAGVELATVHRSVTVHDPCHLNRGQGLSTVMRQLLRSIPGVAITEMQDSDQCCGFGGVMRITHRRLSDRIAEGKTKKIVATKTSTVVTGCPGCRMQITDGLIRAGADIEVLHTVQVLEEALENSECGLRNAELKK